MRAFRKSVYFITILLFSQNLLGQTAKIDTLFQKERSKIDYKSLILPTALLAYGVISLESHELKELDLSTRNEIKEHIDQKFTIDDISQYAPFASVYGLNALGIKGKHNFTDRTIILGTAYIIMGTSVNIAKKTSNVRRPDGTTKNSFPSGHTATAFMGAEFLYQEYKDVSIWYGISGYLVASGTGYFRMHNDRHWFSDVAMGAGIGILSTKIAYWLHPVIKKTFFKKKQHNKQNALLIPYYNGKEYGLAFSMSF